MKINELLRLVRETPGSSDKKQIIRDNNSDVLEMIFKDTYDKSRKYRVKKYDIVEKTADIPYFSIDNSYIIFHNLLEELVSGELSGNMAITRVGVVIGMYDPSERWILQGIIDRNLKVGVSLDNYNDAVGQKTVFKYEVALADKFFDLKEDKQNEVVEGGEYYVSRKLDGVRCNIHYSYHGTPESLQVRFISRQGKELTTLDNLRTAVYNVLWGLEGDWVLDGEVCIVDDNGKESFHGLMSEITRKNHTIANPKFKWFDIVTLADFEGLAESPKFSERLEIMKSLYEKSARPNNIEVLLQERCTGWDVFNKWLAMVDENGWEGFMLKKDVPYKSGRSKDLLKVKKFQDAEYTVEDVVNGKVSYNEGGTKEYDAVSSLVISHKGNRVNVGSGLSKEQRLRWYAHPEEIIGKLITVQYFEETRDKKTDAPSLRFPILKYVYEDGRQV